MQGPWICSGQSHPVWSSLPNSLPGTVIPVHIVDLYSKAMQPISQAPENVMPYKLHKLCNDCVNDCMSMLITIKLKACYRPFTMEHTDTSGPSCNTEKDRAIVQQLLHNNMVYMAVQHLIHNCIRCEVFKPLFICVWTHWMQGNGFHCPRCYSKALLQRHGEASSPGVQKAAEGNSLQRVCVVGGGGGGFCTGYTATKFVVAADLVDLMSSN